MYRCESQKKLNSEKLLENSLTTGSVKTKSKKASFTTATVYDEIEYEEEIEEDDVRIIYQLHYNSWSSHTCPFPNSILQFRRRVRIYQQEVIKDEGDRVGPTIVHCRYVFMVKFLFLFSKFD